MQAVKQQKQISIKCECGGSYISNNKARHMKTLNHCYYELVIKRRWEEEQRQYEERAYEEECAYERQFDVDIEYESESECNKRCARIFKSEDDEIDSDSDSD